MDRGLNFNAIAKAFIGSDAFSAKCQPTTGETALPGRLIWSGLERDASTGVEADLWNYILEDNSLGEAAALIATSAEITGSDVTYDL